MMIFVIVSRNSMEDFMTMIEERRNRRTHEDAGSSNMASRVLTTLLMTVTRCDTC